MWLGVSILSPKEVIFEGRAMSIILPGEEGVFEIMAFHKRILSRLVSGILLVDEESIPIRRGIVKFEQNKATIIVEQE